MKCGITACGEKGVCMENGNTVYAHFRCSNNKFTNRE